MGKYGTLGVILAVIAGFITYFAVAFMGDLQSNSVIEPANATMTVGEMRITPHGGSAVDDEDSTPQGAKGMRAQDLILEVTNGLITGKHDNSVYTIDWEFVDTEGNKITDAKKVVNGEENPIITEAEYTVNRYDNTQINENGSIKDDKTPVNSTKYRWGIYTDEVARTGQPVGLGGEETGVEFNYYGNKVSTDSQLGDYDGDGVSNIDAIKKGDNPYGYTKGDDVKSLKRSTLTNERR